MGGLISQRPPHLQTRRPSFIPSQQEKRDCYLDDNSPVRILEYGLPAIALTAATATTTATAATISTAASARLLGARFIHC